MTPGEVHGLQSLAMAHGGSLTINPKTGLPEAGFLSSLLPMIAGIGLNAMFPGSGMLIGAGIGGLTALASGDLKKGLFAGLGAYGGAGIGESLMAAAPAAGLTPVAGGVVPGALTSTGSGAADLALQQSAALKQAALDSAAGGGEAVGVNAGINQSTYSGAPSAVDKMYAGTKEVFSSPSNAFEFAKANKYPLAAAAAGPVMGMLGTQNTLPLGIGSTGPQNFANYAMKPMQYDPKTGKYLNATYSPVNYSPSYSPNMAYAAGGGSMQDIQANAQPIMPPNQMIGGSAPNENQFYPGANIARGGASQAPSATDVIGGYDQSINQYTGEPMRMLAGGKVSKDAAEMYSDSPGSGPYSDATGAGPYSDAPDEGPYANNDENKGLQAQFKKMSPNALKRYKEAGLKANQRAAAMKEEFARAAAPDDFAPTVQSAQGGLLGMGTYAAGGRLLQGPGDGMSDSIPAVIGGKKPQRAALAQGEFVIPADVVSHLGNGSTDAGSKRLYAMMDKVRHARTGNKKQGRQINPDKFMPA